MARDYAKEYRDYHSKPSQVKRRAKRNAARRLLVKEGRVSKGDNRDIDHIDRNPANNAPSNLRVTSKKANRSRNSEFQSIMKAHQPRQILEGIIQFGTGYDEYKGRMARVSQLENRRQLLEDAIVEDRDRIIDRYRGGDREDFGKLLAHSATEDRLSKLARVGLVSDRQAKVANLGLENSTHVKTGRMTGGAAGAVGGLLAGRASGNMGVAMAGAIGGGLMGRAIGGNVGARIDKKKQFSARESLGPIITFADPRPRNSLGMFSGADGSGIDPEAIGAVYKQGAQAVQQEEGVLSKIGRKLKGRKIRMSARDALGGIIELGITDKAKKAYRGFWHGESATIPSWADAAIESASVHPLAKISGVDANKLRAKATKMAQEQAAGFNRKLLGWSVVPPAIQYGISKRDSNKSERNIINEIKRRPVQLSARQSLDEIQLGYLIGRRSGKYLDKLFKNMPEAFKAPSGLIDRATGRKGVTSMADRLLLTKEAKAARGLVRAERWARDNTPGYAAKFQPDGFSARDALDTILFARGDFLMKTLGRQGVNAPRAELEAIEAAGRKLQGAFNQAATGIGRSDLAGLNGGMQKTRSYLAGSLNEARKTTRGALPKKPVMERPIAPGAGTAPDPRLKTAASYGNTPVAPAPGNYASQGVAPAPAAPVAPAPSAPSVPAQGQIKQPTASMGDHLRYRLRGWRGAAVAGTAGVGAGYAMTPSGGQRQLSARESLDSIISLSAV